MSLHSRSPLLPLKWKHINWNIMKLRWQLCKRDPLDILGDISHSKRHLLSKIRNRSGTAGNWKFNQHLLLLKYNQPFKAVVWVQSRGGHISNQHFLSKCQVLLLNYFNWILIMGRTCMRQHLLTTHHLLKTRLDKIKRKFNKYRNFESVIGC